MWRGAIIGFVGGVGYICAYETVMAVKRKRRRRKGGVAKKSTHMEGASVAQLLKQVQDAKLADAIEKLSDSLFKVKLNTDAPPAVTSIGDLMVEWDSWGQGVSGTGYAAGGMPLMTAYGELPAVQNAFGVDIPAGWNISYSPNHAQTTYEITTTCPHGTGWTTYVSAQAFAVANFSVVMQSTLSGCIKMCAAKHENKALILEQRVLDLLTGINIQTGLGSMVPSWELGMYVSSGKHSHTYTFKCPHGKIVTMRLKRATIEAIPNMGNAASSMVAAVTTCCVAVCTKHDSVVGDLIVQVAQNYADALVGVKGGMEGSSLAVQSAINSLAPGAAVLSAGLPKANVLSGHPIDDLVALVPALAKSGNFTCPACKHLRPTTLSTLIIHMNDTCRMTREQIADYLDTLDIDLTIQASSIGD